MIVGCGKISREREREGEGRVTWPILCYLITTPQRDSWNAIYMTSYLIYVYANDNLSSKSLQGYSDLIS